MKKLLTIAASFIVCLAAMAQGTVNFANNASTLIKFDTVNSPTALQGLPVGSAGGPVSADWHISLFLNGTTTPLGANASLLATTPGRFLGGTRTVDGVGAGGSATFQVAAWSGTAASYVDALASGNPSVYTGITGPITVTLGGGTLPAGALTAANSGFTGVNVSPVPEPSIVALGLLGAAALLIRRRN